MLTDPGGWEALPVASDGERPVPDARRTIDLSAEGNRNAWKHGRFTAKAIARRREVTGLLRAARELLNEESDASIT